jgi:hypothetical protein
LIVDASVVDAAAAHRGGGSASASTCVRESRFASVREDVCYNPPRKIGRSDSYLDLKPGSGSEDTSMRLRSHLWQSGDELRQHPTLGDSEEADDIEEDDDLDDDEEDDEDEDDFDDDDDFEEDELEDLAEDDDDDDEDEDEEVADDVIVDDEEDDVEDEDEA